MSRLVQKLAAPNGRIFELRTGLFVNNQWLAGSAEQVKSISPSYVNMLLLNTNECVSDL